MLSKLSRFIERHLQAGDADTHLSQEQKQLAFAALLVEVALADQDFSASERSKLIESLSKRFTLPRKTVELLIENAQQESSDAVSVHQFTQLINESCSPQEKFELIKTMWETAYADGILNKYEDYTIRKVADLIYVSHADFIRAKSLVKNACGES